MDDRYIMQEFIYWVLRMNNSTIEIPSNTTDTLEEFKEVMGYGGYV